MRINSEKAMIRAIELRRQTKGQSWGEVINKARSTSANEDRDPPRTAAELAGG